MRKKKGRLSWKWKSFIIVVVLAVLFATVLRWGIPWLNTIPPIAQFFIVTFPFLFAISFILAGATFKKPKKILGFFCILFAIDLFVPALIVTLSGATAAADLAGCSAEGVTSAIWFWVPTDILIDNTPLQWFFVYPISFVMFFGTGLLCLNKREVVNTLA